MITISQSLILKEFGSPTKDCQKQMAMKQENIAIGTSTEAN